MVSSVVGMSNYTADLGINSTYSTNSTVPGTYNPFYYFGVWGSSPWQCEPLYDEALKATSEFNKWGSSSASAIMALLPTLIAITSSVTANIGFLCHLSPIQGYIAAALTFGFPVRQLDTWKSVTISVKDLLKLHHGEDAIVLDRVEEILAPIKKMALSPKRPRRFKVQLLYHLLNFVQAILIWCLLNSASRIDTFNIIWLCPGLGLEVYSLWLVATFAILGLLRARFERDSFGSDEIIYIRNAVTANSTGSYTLGSYTLGSYLRRLQDPHPAIVILHPSNHAQENYQHTLNFLDFLIGMSQLLWICLLSFLFSSTIGGTLFRTLIMVVMFVTIIHVSRGLSILACVVAQKHLNIRVIEYDNLQEKRMMQILLGGLTGIVMDIRWGNCKKTQCEESIKMYEWGYKLRHGNVMSDRCIHTENRKTDDIMDYWFPAVFLLLFLMFGSNVPVHNYDHPGSIALMPSFIVVGVWILLMSFGTLGCLHMGLTYKFLICDCN